MAAPVGWTVDNREGCAVITLHGALDLPGTLPLRTALLKCLSEQPRALLVDLSGMELQEPTALSLFTALARQATRWPGTPVLLCAPRPDARTFLERRRYGRLSVHPGLDDALRAVGQRDAAMSAIRDELLPVAGAVRHARNLVTEACLAWDLPDLVGPASLVVSELVSNAVEHAGTMMVVQITRRHRYVHVTVRDGSRNEPRLVPPAGPTALRGRGLLLVDRLAVHWGSLPSYDGKVVWATLAANGG